MLHALVDDRPDTHKALGFTFETFEIARITDQAYTFAEAITLADEIALRATQPHAIILDGDSRSGLDQHDGEQVAVYMKHLEIASVLIGFSSGDEFYGVDIFVDKNGGGTGKLREALLELK